MQLQKCFGLFDIFFNCQKTFYFNSNLYSNKNEFNLSVGKTELDSQVTKLPTYWKTPFSKICLGMKIGKQAKFTVINVHAKQGHSQDFSRGGGGGAKRPKTGFPPRFSFLFSPLS